MESVRDSYSRINPDSPWRWVQVYMVIGMFALLASGWSGRLSAPLMFGVLLAAIAAVFIASKRVGAHDAVTVVNRHAEATRSVRANSHPWLSRGMAIIGGLMLASVLVRTFGLPYVPQDERGTLERLIYSPVMPGLSFLTLVVGWRRPWDLKVVEREPHRTH